ncbi:MAG: glycosyltransferase family A protein, partial [Chloroflexota bacterium]
MIATVVVPAYNAAATLTKCLDSLIAQEIRPNLKLEIVVVDDGSTDQTATIVRRYQGVRLICRPHRGAATARNVGVRAAAPTCTAILFTDADCMPAPDWAMHLVEALENTGPMVAAVKGIYRSNQ